MQAQTKQAEAMTQILLFTPMYYISDGLYGLLNILHKIVCKQNVKSVRYISYKETIILRLLLLVLPKISSLVQYDFN